MDLHTGKKGGRGGGGMFSEYTNSCNNHGWIWLMLDVAFHKTGGNIKPLNQLSEAPKTCLSV